MNAPSVMHTIAGAPEFAGAADLPDGARCWLCAAPATRGVDRVKWAGANFRNQNTCRDQGSAWVCEPCAWVCSWVPPPGIVTPPGKEGVNLRLYSHFWCADDDGDRYLYANKADKPAMREWLRQPKSGRWFAAIADSGKKHVLPWTPMNVGPRGRVRFEERNVWLPDAGGWRLVDDMTRLLTLGVTKDEIERAQCRPRLLADDQVRAATVQFGRTWSGERAVRHPDIL